jgi:hypothetical protein
VPGAKSSAWVGFPPFVSNFSHGPLLSLSLVSTLQSDVTEAELDTVQKKEKSAEIVRFFNPYYQN